MKYSVLMTERNTFTELMHKATNGVRLESTALSVGIHIALEILFAEFENENEFLLSMDDIV